MTNRVNDLKVENARLIFRNFAGRESKFNPAGRRNFNLRLSLDEANALKEQGWNVKIREPREEGEEPLCTLAVTVNYDSGMKPHVYMITSKKKTLLDENTINVLDTAEIESADIILRPYCWEVHGQTGIKAYLKTMYVKLVEDEFASKYAYLDDEEETLDEGELPF